MDKVALPVCAGDSVSVLGVMTLVQDAGSPLAVKENFVAGQLASLFLIEIE